MAVAGLEIQNLRSISHIHLKAGRRWNWLIGNNGVGKSTVLEAIHLLGTGQSWRHGHRQLVQEGCNAYLVRIAILDQEDSIAWLGMHRQGDAREIRFDGRRVDSAWELLDLLPIQAWHEGNAHFASAPAEERRRILDWGVYYADRSYGRLLQEYRRALQQRNAALRQHQDPHTWDAPLARLGEEIHKRREIHLDAITPFLEKIWDSSPQKDVQLGISLQKGWTESLSLIDALRRGMETDQEGAFTHSGPHRARLVFRSDGKNAADVFSRGQLRLAGISFRLAQMAVYRDAGHPLPVVLIDDFANDLDMAAQHWWMEHLDLLCAQVFAATTNSGYADQRAEDHHFYLHGGQLMKGKAL